MRRLAVLLFLIVTLACRENPSPESQAVTTAAAQTPGPPSASVPVEPEVVESAAPAVQGPKLLPVDEAVSDATLVTYRDELLAAVRHRDADAIIARADPKIRTSFGDGGGIEDLRRALAKPGVWEDFEQILTHGGSFVGEGAGRSFWAPYTYSAWPDDRDAFESLAILEKEVPLRESPASDARVIALLSHDIVQRASEPGRDEGAWRHVKTADGKTGWVEARVVRSPIGYRAGFIRTDGQWRMNALVAGD